MLQLFIEALVVGIAVVIFGTVASWFAGLFFKTKLPPVCEDWNKNYVMEIALFLTGVLTHLFFELVGANKWYCKNSYACTH